MRLYIGILFVFCIGAYNAQQVPKWLRNELRLLKVDAESHKKSAQYLLDRIDETLRRSQYMSTNEGIYQRAPQRPVTTTPKPTRPTIPPQPVRYPRNCAEVMARDKRGGWKMIDPDGESGGVEPFNVRCEISGNRVLTEFGLNSEWMQKFEGGSTCIDGNSFGIWGSDVYCTDTEVNVPYKPSLSQMSAAMSVSGNCSQKITWHCHGNSRLYLNPGGNKMFAYGQNIRQNHYFMQGSCECQNDNTCRRLDQACHCGSDMNDIWLRDTITVSNNMHLPVTQVVLGDMAGDRDRAQVYVAPIVCFA